MKWGGGANPEPTGELPGKLPVVQLTDYYNDNISIDFHPLDGEKKYILQWEDTVFGPITILEVDNQYTSGYSEEDYSRPLRELKLKQIRIVTITFIKSSDAIGKDLTKNSYVIRDDKSIKKFRVDLSAFPYLKIIKYNDSVNITSKQSNDESQLTKILQYASKIINPIQLVELREGSSIYMVEHKVERNTDLQRQAVLMNRGVEGIRLVRWGFGACEL